MLCGKSVIRTKKLYDNVIADLVAQSKVIKQGNGLIEDTTMGPLVFAQQQKRVKSYIDKGVEEGAEILTGGSLPFEKGYFVEPTIFADVDHSMTIAREEIFGPVVAAMPFDDLDDLIAKANDTTYGLAAGVWTQDLKKAHYVAHGIKAGTIWVNCYNVFDAASPFGGYKQSGIGREMGSYALDNYTEVKSVWVNMES